MREVFGREFNLKLKIVDASQRFLGALAGVTDPEKKRKIIGREFIEVFEAEARALGGADFLVQGTLYPDVVESVSVRGGPSAVIKSHHNVGGLPEKMNFRLLEPLRELFKDEVRLLGAEMGLPRSVLLRQPFPGPGLAIRILGDVTVERLQLLRAADVIVQEEIQAAVLARPIWQAFAVLLPIQSVGVMGDGRTYEATCALRAVESLDGMTADWAKLPYELLEKISNRITNEVRGSTGWFTTSKPSLASTISGNRRLRHNVPYQYFIWLVVPLIPTACARSQHATPVAPVAAVTVPPVVDAGPQPLPDARLMATFDGRSIDLFNSDAGEPVPAAATLIFSTSAALDDFRLRLLTADDRLVPNHADIRGVDAGTLVELVPARRLPERGCCRLKLDGQIGSLPRAVDGRFYLPLERSFRVVP